MSESIDRSASRRWALALAFAAVYLIWGSTYLAIRIAVQSTPPLLLAASRFCTAGAVLYVAARVMGARAPTKTEWLHGAVTGLLMATVGNGLVSLAEEHVPSNLAALIIACVPLYVALLDWARPSGTRPKASVFAGVALGLVGMALLLAPEPGQASTISPWALLALLGSGLGWALGTLYGRYQPRHPSNMLSAGQQMLVGGALLFVGAVLRGEAKPGVLGHVTSQAVLAFAYLTICGSLIAFSAFSWLVRVCSATQVSTTAYVNPVVAVLLGWWMLDETLTVRALWGAAAILGAVALMSIDVKSVLSAVQTRLTTLASKGP